MENENATKSIIYGNTFQNRYGKFMPICASILDRSSINNILDYLKQTSHFKKFNRVAYAFRVDQMPVVFITEKKNVQTQYYQGCHSDQTIQGSGQKLLHLLEKFNIRNVLIAVLVQQFHPLLPFQCVNYRAIVQNSRLLLDELYRKVIQFQQLQSVQKNTNDLLLSEQKTLKTKKIDLSEQLNLPPPKNPTIPKPHPNHTYSTSQKPGFTMKLTKKSTDINNQQQLQFLWQRCKLMKQQYKKLKDSLDSHQLQQLKYFVMYDKNQLINLVIHMFLIFHGITKQQIIQDFDFQVVKDGELEMLPVQRLRKLDQILKVNRKINVDSILKINRALGMLFSIMDISIRYSKNLQRITAIVDKNQQRLNSMSKQSSNIVKIDPII